jgi:serine/threonine protein kinase
LIAARSTVVRTYIYALGVIFHEMLTGLRPYKADSLIDVILMHKKGPVPILTAELEHYQEMLNLMMAKDPNNRFRDAESLLYFINQLEQRGTIKSPVR